MTGEPRGTCRDECGDGCQRAPPVFSMVIMEFKLCGPTASQTFAMVAAREDIRNSLGRKQMWGKASWKRKLFSEHPDATIPESGLSWTFEP